MVLTASKGISAKQVNLNRHQPPPCGWRDLKMANLSWEGWVTVPTPDIRNATHPPLPHHLGQASTHPQGVTNDSQKWVTGKNRRLASSNIVMTCLQQLDGLPSL